MQRVVRAMVNLLRAFGISPWHGLPAHVCGTPQCGRYSGHTAKNARSNGIHLLVIWLCAAAALTASAAPTTQPTSAPISAATLTPPHELITLRADPRLHLDFGPERIILPRGLQPSLLCTADGTLIVQAQIPDKPLPTQRMHYPSALQTVVSRDAGLTWTPFPIPPGTNGLDLEGGAIQLRDKTILALDTYVTPGGQPDHGVAQLYTSADDWRTLAGPRDVDVLLPNIDFYASSDDGGHPHAACRVHRRFVEMPDGSLLTTIYGQLKGDHDPCPYQPRMMKSRILLIRSADRGLHWQMISTIALDPLPGTEGLGEATLCRVSAGPHAGRLICLMRTGRNLYHATSDDEGKSWATATPLIFADRDVERSELWADQFRHFKDFHGKLLDEDNQAELRGAAVDPDLTELRDGTLVASFGVRVPQKLCWQHPEHPWNGNYLAFSLDHGDTWTHVVQLTSGVLTTHYTAITETPTNGEVYVAYDLGGWSRGMMREIIGRTMKVARVESR